MSDDSSIDKFVQPGDASNTDTKPIVINATEWADLRQRYDDIDLYRQIPRPRTLRPDEIARKLSEIWGNPHSGVPEYMREKKQ
jgi:hypothetical protein